MPEQAATILTVGKKYYNGHSRGPEKSGSSLQEHMKPNIMEVAAFSFQEVKRFHKIAAGARIRHA